MAIIKSSNDYILKTNTKTEKDKPLLIYKYLDENCKTIKIKKDKVVKNIRTVLSMLGENWLLEEVKRYENQTTSIFHVHPLIVAACSSTAFGLFEFYTLGKYLNSFKKDKNIEHIISMLKSPNQYNSTKFQLSMAFNFINSYAKSLELEEPVSSNNRADFQCILFGEEYIVEASFLNPSKVANTLDNCLAMVINNLTNRKKNGEIPNEKFFVTITFNSIHETDIKKTNLFELMLQDIKNCLKSKMDTNISNSFYSITSKMLKQEEEYPRPDINSFDKQATLKTYVTHKGITELDRFDASKIYKEYSSARFLIKYPTTSEEERIKQLREKLSDENKQLSGFKAAGKVIMLFTDQWYLVHKGITKKVLEEFIDTHSDVSTILISWKLDLIYKEHNYSYLSVANTKNKFALSDEYIKQLIG